MKKQDGMIDLFSGAGLSLVDISSKKSNFVDCYAMSFKDKIYQDPLQLFEGFSDLKVVTFSFDFTFAARISKKFDSAQILVGAEFMMPRINKDITEQAAEFAADKSIVKKYITQNQKLAKRIVEGAVEVRYPELMNIHSKLYLLKADNGNVRVIFPSANFSTTAWNVNHHLENYMFCDDKEFYDSRLYEFEALWQTAGKVIPNANLEEQISQLPEENLSENADSNYDPLYDDNAIDIGTAFIVEKVEDEEKIILTQHNKDLEEFTKTYKELFKDIKFKADKNGKVIIGAKEIKKITVNAEQCRLNRVKVEIRSEYYPHLLIDYPTNNVFIDKLQLNLSPSDDEVKSDIKELLGLFENYNKFVNKTYQAQHNHFKLLNLMFSSIFNAKFRCLARIKKLSTAAFPLFILLNSPPDCGKSFMVKVILKMMTGIEDLGYTYNEIKKDQLQVIQETFTNIPIFIDEVSSSFTKSFEGIIKSAEDCEKHMRENQPLVIFASNDVGSPKKELCKRMVYFTYDMFLPSSANRREYETMGNLIQHRINNAFFRKYLSIMLPYVNSEIEKIEEGEKFAPEILKRSSEIILEIIKQYGFEIPSYMKVVNFDDDYADYSRSTYQNSLDEIKQLYYSEKGMFDFDDNFVTISFDKENGNKICKIWYNSVPKELKPTIIPGAEFTKIRFDRTMFENIFEIKFESSVIKNFIKKLWTE